MLSLPLSVSRVCSQLTSIGYGEFTPVNSGERALCSIYMMASGFMWAWAIGSIASILTTLDPNTVLHQNTMDALNYFMRERELPRAMRMTLRDYFNSARYVHQINDDGDLLDKMTPMLQGSVALAANQKWLEKVRASRDLALWRWHACRACIRSRLISRSRLSRGLAGLVLPRHP